MLDEILQAQREKRMEELEKEYELSDQDSENEERIHELFCYLSVLVGKSSQYLLREYTDRLIARFNKNPDWFYIHGYEDAKEH